MSNFADKDRRSLELNPLIQSVGPNKVKFTPKFKIKALKLHNEGLKPADIFLKLGVDPNLFLEHYPKKCLSRWRKIFDLHGEEGFHLERRGKGAVGRPKKPELKGEKALRARIAILEAEVEFLKKIRALADKTGDKKGTR